MKSTWIGFGLLLLIAGCRPSAAILWSPDGKQGIYVVCQSPQFPAYVGDGSVIDTSGKITGSLGLTNPSWGVLGLTSAAWCDDSKTAYVSTADDPGGKQDLAGDWDAKRAVPDRPPGPGEKLQMCDAVLSYWTGEKCVPLARFPHCTIGDVKLSPDRKWVAVSTMDLERQRFELYAYAVDSHKLYRVDNDAAPSVCFTGPHLLAYVTITDAGGPGSFGETDLDESTTELKRSNILEVQPMAFGFTTPVQTPGKGDGVLFLAEKASFPRKTGADTRGMLGPMTLFRWDRGTGDVTELADHLVSMSPSPDGKTLLCIVDAGEKNWIELLDPDGTHPRHLIEIDKEKVSVLPTWHGNDRITMAGPSRNPDGDREDFGLMDRAILPDGKLGPAIDLSRDWGDKCREPWYSNKSGVQ